MAEAVVAVSTPDRGRGLRADHVDRLVLEVEGIAASAADGPACPTLGKPLSGIEVRVVDPDTRTPLATRQVGEFELRGENITSEYLTARGSVAAQDADGWNQIGDLDTLPRRVKPVICGRRKGVIIISGRNLYPTDIERAAERVAGVRTGNAIAVTFAAGSPGEGFAVLAESAHHNDEALTLQLRRAISTAVFKAVCIPPRTVTVLCPEPCPKPPPANCADPAPAHSLQRSMEPTRGAGHNEMVVLPALFNFWTESGAVAGLGYESSVIDSERG
ncbi:acyl-CoA synthetase (AMP-forming)/AMP-acid ligase II [Rhodococcus sp. BE178]|nr:AMP-binding protein [Rhodococcus sp. W8901]